MKLTKRIAAIAGAVAFVAATGGTALAATDHGSSPSAVTVAASSAATPATDVHGCVYLGANRTLEHVYSVAGSGGACPKNTFAVDLTGPAGPKGATGATGPQGPAGQAGVSAVTSITASTNVTEWPESSGWAADAFGRGLTETVQHAAPSADCGGTPQCWFVTGQISDNGTFQTVAGAQSPNGSSTAKIAGVLDGTIVGTADFEFYASSNKISASTVPVSMTGADRTATTSTWGELAFPQETTFDGVKLTAYSWTYTAPKTCEQWLDQINPGDDGQGAPDGNITGVNACN
jgi:hypothetical protein